MRRGWMLWQHWCEAVGIDDDQVSDELIERFQREVVAGPRRIDDIRATARERGLLPGPRQEPTDPWASVEDLFADLDACLRRCPSAGWPVGYVGRRDAWLLVLTRGLRLTRAQAVAVTSADLVEEWRIRDRPVPLGTDPATCWRCIVARWLACRETEDSWGRTELRGLLIRARTTHREPGDHDCRRRGGIVTLLPTWAPLAPALNQYGGISGVYRPIDEAAPDGSVALSSMTTRSVTAVLARRCLADLAMSTDEGADTAIAAEPDVLESESGSSRDFDETTFARLDAACARAEEVNERMTRLLDETDSAVATSSVARPRRPRDTSD